MSSGAPLSQIPKAISLVPPRGLLKGGTNSTKMTLTSAAARWRGSHSMCNNGHLPAEGPQQHQTVDSLGGERGSCKKGCPEVLIQSKAQRCALNYLALFRDRTEGAWAQLRVGLELLLYLLAECAGRRREGRLICKPISTSSKHPGYDNPGLQGSEQRPRGG